MCELTDRSADAIVCVVRAGLLNHVAPHYLGIAMIVVLPVGNEIRLPQKSSFRGA